MPAKSKMALSKKRVAFLTILFVIIASVAPLAIYIESALKEKMRYQGNATGDYLAERKILMDKDTVNRTGQSLVLSDNEKRANAILMGWKRKELDSAFATSQFIGAESFITAKSKIEQSQVFKIIKKMPKGKGFFNRD